MLKEIIVVGLLALLLFGCSANQSILESANRNSTPAANISVDKSSMEQDMEAIRNADFKVVFVLRRKDGGELDANDRAFARSHTGQANRRVSADNGRAVIVGSNYSLEAKSLDALKERFLFEDHSPSAADANSNSAMNN